MSADYSRYSSVAAMFGKLKWEPLEIRRRRSRLTLFYKAVNGLVAVPTVELKHPQRRLEDVLTQLATSQSYTQIPTPYAIVSSIAPSEIGTTYQTKSSNPLQ